MSAGSTANPVVVDEAVAHHRAGRLAAAEAAYRNVLVNRPDEPTALQGLALIEFGRGNAKTAQQLLNWAIAAHGGSPAAAACYGNLGPVLAALGRPQEAMAAYRRAIELRPTYPEAHNNLAKLLYSLGRASDAVAEFRLALQQQNGNADIWNNLGLVLRSLGSTDEAIEAFRKAIVCRREFADAHNNLAIALHAKLQLDEAIAAGREAVRLRPDSGECFNTLGNALQARGDLAEAVDAYRRAIALRPNLVEAHNNLGNALRGQRRLDEAIAAYRAALAIAPNAAKVHNNLGNTLQAVGDLDGAAAALARSLELQPAVNLARSNMGNVLKDRGEVTAALGLFRQAMEERPFDPVPHSNFLYTLWYEPGQDLLSLRAAHEQWNHRHAAPLRAVWRAHSNNRAPERRLRIGYVSPNFRDHCQTLFLWPLLANHDRSAVEIYCYSDVLCPDSATDKLRQKADAWRNIVGQSDDRVAEQVRQDEIDILVDLTLHMAHGRLLTFARRSAPVQVSWLGYPGTTGLEAIDYRLTDPHLDPPAAHAHQTFVEAEHRLRDTFWCYDPMTTEPAVSDLPARANGFITFGCLNNFCKINSAVLSAWAAVLRATPQSRLVMMVPRGLARERVLKQMQNEAVSVDRIELLPFQPRAQYLATYQRIDLGLDTFPYNGHTTTLDSLWMGVPVVTPIGNTVVGRAGFSMLRNLQMAELAAQGVEQYIDLAQQWATDLDRLATVRANLRGRMTASPLMDGPGFARAIEAAYRQMWRTWCARKT